MIVDLYEASIPFISPCKDPPDTVISELSTENEYIAEILLVIVTFF